MSGVLTAVSNSLPELPMRYPPPLLGEKNTPSWFLYFKEKSTLLRRFIQARPLGPRNGIGHGIEPFEKRRGKSIATGAGS